LILGNIANYTYLLLFLGYFMFFWLQLARKSFFGEDWFRIHGFIVQTNFRQNSIFCYQRKFSLLTEGKIFIIKSDEVLNTWRITNPSLYFYDALYFLLFISFYKSFGL